MAAYVLKGLRVLGFLTLFAISSKLYFFIYGDTAILNGNTAFQVAGLFNNNPTPEDAYAISDYAVLVVNIIVAIVAYSVGINLIPIKNLLGKGFSQHIANIAKGIALRILKVVSVIGLFALFVCCIDYDRFVSPDAEYGAALVFAITTFLTLMGYGLFVYMLRRLMRKKRPESQAGHLRK
ncbi:hypothetical protein [Rahnella bonaserana]|uniref:hypothetical protein n=1 Tax=Rahnella bonaserana TaxID=2816248 RepID=UPI00320A18E1